MSPISDRFSRVRDLYGEDGFERIRSARVAVIGLGGVGAHATVALARSGIGALLLCDHDLITPSSLNRSPVATEADIGRAKTEVLAAHLALACPDTQIEDRLGFVDDAAAAEILVGAVDLVVDAIDGLGPKAGLLARCVRQGVPVVSSMGASSRTGVGSVRVADISETAGCPLARLVRSRLRRLGIHRGIVCVYSSEPPRRPLSPDEGDVTLRRGRPRSRHPGAICLPGIFGYALAAVVLDSIARRH